LPILLLLAGGVVAALVVPRLLADSSSNGLAEGANSPAGDAVGIARVRDFDPEGDNNSEHPEDVRLAADGEPSTAWSTEDYTSPLQELKSGVGLLFELEGSAEVSDIRVSSPAPGFAFEIRASDEPSDDIDGYEVVDESSQTRESVTLSLSEPTTRRYWVLWITELAGGGAGRAEVGEVEFFGS
jgi:hypothetical protein